MRKSIPWLITVSVLLVMLGGGFFVGLYFDYLWFVELEKTTIFTTVIYAKSMLGGVTLFISFLFLYINFVIANRGPGLIELGIPTPTGQITAVRVEPETVRRVAGLVAAAIGLIVGTALASHWEKVWRWMHSVNFNETDPIFGKDISFYFFSLPFWREILYIGLGLCFVALLGIIILYYFKGVLSWHKVKEGGGLGRPAVHISLLAAMIFILMAVSAYLSRYELLYGAYDIFYGAGYADIYARMPMLMLLAIVSVAGAALWLYSAFSGRLRMGLAAVALYMVVAFLGGIYPSVIQKLIVDPNELERETPQIMHNIMATRKAYGLDNVVERDLSGDMELTVEDIGRNATTINSIRLWDHEPLLDALKQIQEIRTYYDFVSVSNDRYWYNNELKQTMLSARELNSASLPERNWINEHLIYTHGYGVAIGPVNRMTSEGLPVLHVQNIPPVSEFPIFNVDHPEIYFGELSTSYVVINTGMQEFNYPSGDQNVFTNYSGTGGVPVKSLFRKLLFSFYFGDTNIVLSPLITSESRFLYFRNVRERFRRVAPFLMLDRNPYMVVSEGRLYWIQDAYTRSDRYPYSAEIPGVGNYIRNSVKMVMDAYNGTVDMYITDPEDPVIQVYQKIFPGILRPLDEISDDLRSHLRYPEDIFHVQTRIYATYHMITPKIFYNKEDLWQVPSILAAGADRPMSPYYTIMRLPQEKTEEFILMLPFTPDRKDNLSAWMVARSDGENYGQLVVYRFPKQQLIFGPRQIIARFSQDAEIARQVSLWDQRGSQVIQGNLLVIPIEEALLYIRPLYLRAESGRIPELKRVIVAFENRIAMEETLEESIAQLFQQDINLSNRITAPGSLEFASLPMDQAPEISGGAVVTDAISHEALRLSNQAGDAFNSAVAAQREGNWARYGEELRRLGETLEELKRGN